MILACTVLLSLWICGNRALENGLARTPPMGWMSWQRFRCQVDCILYPDDCISERLIKRTVDRMVSDGYRDAGYRYVIIDDCWSSKMRHQTTKELVSDPARFPSGMKALGDYIHRKGLLFGIYLDYGKLTCAGYPGSINHLELDAKSLAKWGVDYVKVDGCHSMPDDMPRGYEKLGRFLNMTGRPIVYSCSYPAYIDWAKDPQLLDWNRLINNCNLWRLYYDIQDSWSSLLSIINFFKDNQQVLQRVSGPGHWNDPDMLLLGNFGLSKDQMRTQMGMWAMLTAPMMMSTDLNKIDSYSKNLLLNRRLLAINQDVNGRQAVFLGLKNGVQLWTRPMTHRQAKWAIALFYGGSGGGPIKLPIRLTDMGIRPYRKNQINLYTLRDVFNGTIFGLVRLKEEFHVDVNPNGIAMFEVEEKPLPYGGTRFDFVNSLQ